MLAKAWLFIFLLYEVTKPVNPQDLQEQSRRTGGCGGSPEGPEDAGAVPNNKRIIHGDLKEKKDGTSQY